jgi:hypothetical protein
MPDLIETSSQGWFSRILASIKGVLVGLTLVVASFPLLWVNEGCAVKIARGLAEGRGQVVEAPSTAPNPALEGRLVHTTGRVATATGAQDTEFQLALRDAVRLDRDVEMYQWVEKVTERKEKNLGGSEETVRETTYVKEWSSSAIDSRNFKLKQKDGEPTTNPSLPLAAQEFRAHDVKLGVFRLSDGLVGDIGGRQPVTLDASVLQHVPAAARARGQAQLADGGIFIGASPSAPRVGDLRIRFHKVPAGDASVVARLSSGALGPWTTSTGTTIEMLEDGTKTADQMFASAEAGNAARTWLLRVIGLFLMWIGFSMIFRPLSVVADVVPFVGTLVGWGTGVVSFALAAPLSLLTIALAWIAYRPLLGIALLVVGGGVFGGLFVMSRRRRT